MTWCDGEEAKELLLTLPEEAQYRYGGKAAQMLYAYTVAVTMEEERAEAQFMFADQIERIKNGRAVVPDWYRD